MSHQYAVKKVLDHYDYLTAEHVTGHLRYSTFVSMRERYLYFAVPKAACTQLKEILRALEGSPPVQWPAEGGWESRRDMFVHARQNVPLPSLVDLNDEEQREVLESPDFLRMTVVRNPYTRLLSAWKNKVRLCEPGYENIYVSIRGHLPQLGTKSLITFEEFVGYIARQCDLRTCDPHWRRQVDHAYFDAMNYSYVGKLEEMPTVLDRFQQHVGLSKAIQAQGKNVSRQGATAAYTPELAAKVCALYQADFERLGYSPDARPGSRLGTSGATESAVVSEEEFNDEIIERNLVLSALYQERTRLREELGRVQGELRRVTRFRLLGLANALTTLRRISLKIFSGSSTRQSAPSTTGGFRKGAMKAVSADNNHSIPSDMTGVQPTESAYARRLHGVGSVR
jgi:hypothetical protein